MDEVYEWGESHRNRPVDFDQEADSAMRQGVEPRWGREFYERDSAYIRGGVRMFISMHPFVMIATYCRM